MTPFTTTIPLRLESLLNMRLGFRKKAKLVKELRAWGVVVPLGMPVPCTVLLTRIAPRKLDDDNLQGAFKPLRDGIADRLRVNDGGAQVSWLYSQESGRPREYAVRITIIRRPERG